MGSSSLGWTLDDDRGFRGQVRRMLTSTPYTVVITIVILFTVFAWDVAEGWLSGEVDTLVEALLTGAFLFFVIELLLMAYAVPRWWSSWSFWIAFVATAAMVLEIPWMSQALLGVSRSAGGALVNLRLIRIFRLLARVGRLIRVLRALLESRIRTAIATLLRRRDVEAMTRERLARQRIADMADSRIWQSLETTTTIGVTAIIALFYIVGTLFLLSQRPGGAAAAALQVAAKMGGPEQSRELERIMTEYPVLSVRNGPLVLEGKSGTAGRSRDIELVSFGELQAVLDLQPFNAGMARRQTGLTALVFATIAAIVLFLNWAITRFSMELSGALKTLARALDERDPYTRMHSYRVSVSAAHIAARLGMSKREQQIVRIAGELHDIGKIGVPEEVLQKPGRLTDEEFEIMKRHTLQGAKILGPLTDFDTVILGVRYHHEKLNGKGYPDGLTGDEVPRIARILCVCDIWDALTSDRPYREAMSLEKARSILLETRGSELDPTVVDAFFEVYDAIQAELESVSVPPLGLVGPVSA